MRFWVRVRVGGSEGSEGGAHLADVLRLDRATRRHAELLLDLEHARSVGLGQVGLVRARGGVWVSATLALAPALAPSPCP